jgi:hypothetical protein
MCLVKSQVEKTGAWSKNAGQIAGAWCLVLGRIAAEKQVESQVLGPKNAGQISSALCLVGNAGRIAGAWC